MSSPPPVLTVPVCLLGLLLVCEPLAREGAASWEKGVRVPSPLFSRREGNPANTPVGCQELFSAPLFSYSHSFKHFYFTFLKKKINALHKSVLFMTWGRERQKKWESDLRPLYVGEWRRIVMATSSNTFWFPPSGKERSGGWLRPVGFPKSCEARDRERRGDLIMQLAVNQGK